LNHIFEEIDAHSLWDKLFLIEQMMVLKYLDGTCLNDHLNYFQKIINQLATMGIKFDDDIKTLWLFDILPDS